MPLFFSWQLLHPLAKNTNGANELNPWFFHLCHSSLSGLYFGSQVILPKSAPLLHGQGSGLHIFALSHQLPASYQHG